MDVICILYKRQWRTALSNFCSMAQKTRVIALRKNPQHIRSCGNSQFQRYGMWYITQADLRVKHNSILFLPLLLCKRNILVFSLIKGQLEHSGVGTILKENRLRFHSQACLKRQSHSNRKEAAD